LADFNATWDVHRFGGLPHLATEAGVVVVAAVTIQEVTLSQIHPFILKFALKTVIIKP
jgi:hypothetical protein